MTNGESRSQTCPICNGAGSFQDGDGFLRPCRRCNGGGHVIEAPASVIKTEKRPSPLLLEPWELEHLLRALGPDTTPQPFNSGLSSHDALKRKIEAALYGHSEED